MLDDDWRLTGQEEYLSGAVLQWQSYLQPSLKWDHDHCEFCGAKFMEAPQPATLHAGHATLDGYHWICANCFGDREASANAAPRKCGDDGGRHRRRKRARVPRRSSSLRSRPLGANVRLVTCPIQGDNARGRRT
jgi:hypothetical protein